MPTFHTPCFSSQVTVGADGVSLAYQLHGAREGGPEALRDGGPPGCSRMLMIMGLSATQEAWYPTIEALCSQAQLQPLVICTFDNRGVGASSSPESKHSYTTAIMAQDAVALMDHLGWDTAHIVGFSMGSMISSKLAAAAPSRVQSLTLMALAGGGWHSIPTSLRAWKWGLRASMAKTPEERAKADIKLHFTKDTLRQQALDAAEHAANGRLQDMLLQDYTAMTGSVAPQPKHGSKGQLAAVWSHRMTTQEWHDVQTGGFPAMLIHGAHDVVARASYAMRVAAKLAAPLLLLPAGHFVSRECGEQVEHLLSKVLLKRDPLSSAQRIRPIFLLATASAANGGAHAHGADATGTATVPTVAVP